MNTVFTVKRPQNVSQPVCFLQIHAMNQSIWKDNKIKLKLMYLVYKTSTISSSSPSVLSGLSPNNVTPLNRCDKSSDADHSSKPHNVEEFFKMWNNYLKMVPV